jgi:hypothetical protein
MSALADDINENYQTVQKWRCRNRIPAEYWTRLVIAGNERRISISIDGLAKAAAAEKAA